MWYWMVPVGLVVFVTFLAWVSDPYDVAGWFSVFVGACIVTGLIAGFVYEAVQETALKTTFLHHCG